MNYRLNLYLMMAVFSVVTYNVCMAYQDMQDVSVQGKFQEIGLLKGQKAAAVVPPRKPAAPSSQLAAL